MCEYWEILNVVFPFLEKMHGFEQRNYHHCYDILEHTAAVTSAIPATVPLRLAAFFHDCGKPDRFSLDEQGVGHFYGHAAHSASIAEQTMNDLKLDRKTTRRVTELVRLHDSPIDADPRIIRRKLNRYGAEFLFDLIALQRADTLGLAPEFHKRLAHIDELERLTKEVIDAGTVFSLRDLAVNGNDLKKRGLHGKEIGRALQTLLNAVLDDKVKNEKASLLEYLSANP